MHKKYNDYANSLDNKVETVKVALYLRLSRDDGDKSESNPITNQIFMLVCESNPITNQHKYLA